MLNAFKAIWGRHQRVLSNFFSLSVLQFVNYLAPLITLPYLFRVLGDSRYGLVEFARAITVYFLTLTDYGFSLSATREISVHRDDPRKISEVFSAVMILKLLLVLLSLLCLFLLVAAIPKLRAEWPVYVLSFGHVVGQWLFPVWLFQGLERMKHMTVLSVVGKALVIASIFIFIHEPADYLYVPLLQSGGNFVVGLAGLVVALRDFPVRFRIPGADALVREFRNGWYLFISKMATTLYTTSNVVILGLFADTAFVGYYAAGDKLVRAVQGLQLPLSQAIFPHIGRLASQSKEAALRFTARVTRLLSAATLVMSLGLLVGAPYIARAALGEQSQAAVPVIRILAFLPFIIGLSNMFGVQVMVNFGLNRALTRILLLAGVFNIIVALALVAPLRHIGVSIAALLTETLVTTAMFVSLRKRGLDVLQITRGDCCEV